MVYEVLNLIALIVIPVFAVFIARYLQDRSEKRKDKMQAFKVLMIARIYGWTEDSVRVLNVLDIIFSDDNNVRQAWKDLYDKLCTDAPDANQVKKITQAQYKLLETMAKSLGYRNKITWETIQNPYIPNGMLEQMNRQNASQQNYNEVLEGIKKLMPGTEQNESN